MLSSENFQELLEPRFRKIFFDTYAELPEEFPDIYKVHTSKKAQEHDYHVAGTGLWEKKVPGQAIQQEEIDTGDEVSYIHEAYAKMITIERELADDELYGVMDKLPRKLARGGRARVEMIAAATLNNGFLVSGYDGVPLFSDSHPLIKGGTADNLMPSAPLSDTSLKEGMIMMRKNMVTEEGLKMQAKATDLVIPPDLEFRALTILQSVGQSDTGNRADNVIRNKLRPIVLSYLTSPTAWFLRDKVNADFNFFWRVKPEFKGAENFDNMVAKYRGYLRFSLGYSDWRGWLGNTGTSGD
jgi:phage major head subunit gpT-like protein